MGKPLPPTDAEDAPTITRMSVREKPVEVITRGERRRVWMDAQKHDIVLESLEPGGSPIAVARRHGIGTGRGTRKTPPRCLEWVACVSLPCPGSQRHPLQGCFFVRLKRAVSSSRPDDAQGGARRRGQGWPLGHRALGAALGVLDGGEHGARLGQDGRLGMDDHA
jgi:hypothetical protein